MEQNEDFNYLEGKIKLSYTWTLLIGVLIGLLISALF
jgi:hypothetical protein